MHSLFQRERGLRNLYRGMSLEHTGSGSKNRGAVAAPPATTGLGENAFVLTTRRALIAGTVASLRPQSFAELVLADLATGRFRQHLDDLDSLRGVIEQIRGRQPDEVILFVERGRESFFFAVKPDWD